MSTPYTYLVGWKQQDRWYYGVRYATGCHPSDFWKKYFTSSKKVAALRIEIGEPDVIEIRRTFTTPADAKKWEEVVIRRMGAVKSKKWLNQCNHNKLFCRSGPLDAAVKLKMRLAVRPVKTEEHRRNLSISSRARPPLAEVHRKKMSESAKARWTDEQRLSKGDAMRGRTLSVEHKQKISAAGKGRVVSEETRAKQSIAIRAALQLSKEKRKTNG